MKRREVRKKLSRGELLSMLDARNARVEELEYQVTRLEAERKDREIRIDRAGSIAEAALQLSGVFEAAEQACLQYKENVRMISSRQEEICARAEAESRAEAERLVREAAAQSEQIISDAKKQSETLICDARLQSNSYWLEVSRKLEVFYDAHPGLREMLDEVPDALGDRRAM